VGRKNGHCGSVKVHAEGNRNGSIFSRKGNPSTTRTEVPGRETRGGNDGGGGSPGGELKKDAVTPVATCGNSAELVGRMRGFHRY